MSSNTHSDIDKTLLTKDKDKYHILLIYLLDDHGNYGGAYHEMSLSMTGGVGGKSFNETLEQAYESLEEVMEGENQIPFDINNIKESVVFDCGMLHHRRR
jgi:predicted RNase H-like HicB family nuclease